MKFDFLGLKTLTVLDIAHAAHRPPDRRGERVRSLDDPARRQADLPAPRLGRDQGRVPARVERHAAALQGSARRLLRGHRRRRRPLPPRPARQRHGEGLRRPQARPRAGREPAPDGRRDPRADLRRHRLPGAGHADRAGARGLHARRRRPPPPRDGQEEARGDGQAEEHLRRRLDPERRHARRRRAHLRTPRVLRRVRLQQIALGRVRAHHVPDRVAQGALPGRAPLRDPHERQGSHRQGGPHDRRRARDGHHGAPAGHQRERHRLQGRLRRRIRRTRDVAGTERRASRRARSGCCRRFASGSAPSAASAWAALEAVFEARKSGPFIDLFDFAARVDASEDQQGRARGARAVRGVRHDVSRRAASRARRRFASIDIALERSRAASRDRERGQTNLFGLFDAAVPAATRRRATAPSAGDYGDCSPWDRQEMLVRERQSLGFYVSGHPLERYLQAGPPRSRALEALPSRDACIEQDAGPSCGSRAWSRATASALREDGGGKSSRSSSSKTSAAA